MGTQYQTASMDFTKAEIAFEKSAASSVITADFSPKKITVTFPDNYTKELDNVDFLPAITLPTVDPARQDVTAGYGSTNGEITVLSLQLCVQMYMEGNYTGDIPANFTGITTGPHSLEFRKDGYSSVTKTINLTSGQTHHLSVLPAGFPPTATPGAPGFTGILAGIARTLCGIVLIRP